MDVFTKWESLFDPYSLETRFVIGRLSWRRQISSGGNNASCLVHLEYLWYIYLRRIYHSRLYFISVGIADRRNRTFRRADVNFVSWISLPCHENSASFTFIDQRRYLGESILCRFISVKWMSRVDNVLRRNWLNGWSLALSDLHISVRGFCIDT